MKKRILELLRDMVGINSVTNTEYERLIEDYLYEQFCKLPYFAKHGTYFGQIAIPGDAYGRRVVYGLVKGNTNKTVVLLNHHDVVSTEVYGELEPYAFNMSELAVRMKNKIYDADTNADLNSNQWLFGRGSCDMKGGIAAQIAVLEEYSKNPNDGSLLFVSVPDEESFSAGMRGALWLFEEFKKDWELDYKLLINCEPNEQIKGKQIVSVGSVGKLLPVVLVQGKTVQIGNYDEGINPVAVLARLVCATEYDLTLVEKCGTEKTIPPVWSYMRDLKESYDFSLPQQAVGYCNILTFSKTPVDIMDLFLEKCRFIAGEIYDEKNASLKIKVLTYADLVNLAKTKEGFAKFSSELNEDMLKRAISEGIDYPAQTISIMKKMLNFAGVSEPVIVIAFAPPYYPAVNSIELVGESFDKVMHTINNSLPSDFKQYFLGVSDCSYCGMARTIDSSCYTLNTPVWGKMYSFNIDILNKMKIPFVLLGPWGKNLHQNTERVNVKSLTETLPSTLNNVLQCVWDS